MEKKLCVGEVLKIMDDSSDDLSDFSELFDEGKLTMILINIQNNSKKNSITVDSDEESGDDSMPVHDPDLARKSHP